jgi:hypothetical protein
VTDFSPATLAVIGDFATYLGLPPIAQAAAPVRFEFSHWGNLTLTMAEESRRVLVFLERAPAFGAAPVEPALLARAGFDATQGWFVHAGLADDGGPLCFISIEEVEFDLVTLDRAITHLVAWLDAATGGSVLI